MPRPLSQRGSQNESHTGSSDLSRRLLVLARFVCVVLGAWTLVGCSPRAAPQQVPAVRVATPGATTAVAPPTVSTTSPPLGSQFTLLAARDGVVSVAADLSDGRARFYSIRNREQWIPFFVVQGADGIVRAALDACDVCFESKEGFREEGNEMVCNACGSRFPITQINVERGGCNPAGLPATVLGDQVTIRLADLEAGARYF